jgi:hypothetical protein|tara:strand:- start:382 stop:516 length:135 start_codon:yes stop_codon:yes gene_type:complete
MKINEPYTLEKEIEKLFLNIKPPTGNAVLTKQGLIQITVKTKQK